MFSSDPLVLNAMGNSADGKLKYNLAFLSKIFWYTRDYYPVLLIYAIGMNILTLTVPISIKSVVNTFALGPSFQPLLVLSLVLLGFLTVLGILQTLNYLLTEYLQRRIHAQLTGAMAKAILFRAKDQEPKVNYLQLSNRYFDIVSIQKGIAFLVADGLGLALQLVLGLILIALYHPYFIGFGILVIFIVYAIVRFYWEHGRRTALEESTAKYKTAEFIESLTVTEVAPDQIEAKLQATDEMLMYYLQARTRHFSVLLQQNILFVTAFAFLNALLLGGGGSLVISHQISLGELVAAEIVLNSIFYYFLTARKYLEVYFDMFASAAKVGVFESIHQLNMDEHVQPTFNLQRILKSQQHFFARFKTIRAIYYPRHPWQHLGFFGLGAVFVALLCIFIPWQQTSPGSGRVIAFDPNDRTQEITATVDGRVERWLVRDGQTVKEGEPLVEIVDNDPEFLRRLEVELNAAIQKFEAAKEASQTAKLNYERQKRLAQSGLSANKDFEKAKVDYKKLISDEAEAAAKLANAEVKFSRQHRQTVMAPRDGQILHVLKGSGSVFVKSGEPVATFVPSTAELAVELFIDGNDLPLVHPDRHVRLQFEGWPAIQFSGFPRVAIGSFGGLVKIVDPVVNAQGNFRVVIQPDPADPHPWPSQELLRQGARAVGLILLDQVPLGYEIWRYMNGFPKSLNQSQADLYQQSPSKKK